MGRYPDEYFKGFLFIEDPFFTKPEGDLLNLYMDIIKKYNIHCVVNTVGLPNVEECEKNFNKALESNANYVNRISKVTNSADISFIHISTDHLFSDVFNINKESDIISAVNNYALTKYKGENYVLSNHKKALILRTNFYGNSKIKKKSFSDWIFNNLETKTDIFLFDDVFFNPVPADLLVELSHELVFNGFSGIFNISADNFMTKYEFGCFLAKYAHKDLNYIHHQSLDQRTDLIKRPKCMILSNQKLRNALGRSIGDMQLHCMNLINDYKNIL